MDVLLDTHIALWALDDSPRLSHAAAALLADPKNRLFVSVISGWEVSIKHVVNEKSLAIDGSTFLSRCQAAGYETLSFTEHHLAALDALTADSKKLEHKDPFDRALIAQAKAENLLLLTHDKMLLLYEEPHVHVV